MNDFTQDELKHLYVLVHDDQFFPRRSNYCQFSKNILDKLKFMIEKHCNHIWNHKHESGFVVCDKCENVYTTNP